MADDCELLFFDTFSHDSCEELNLDLVQFPRPVYIFEIRVIPLGARVQADFPGGHRLGATNPSSFQLEFFVNDLSKRSASTFERLGSMEYKQNVDIQFPVPNKIPTDGLVLRGWYSAVTLAVYGVLTKITKERSSPPPPPPPQSSTRQQSQEHCPVKDFGSPVTDTQIPEWERQPRMTEVPPEPPPPPVRAHQSVMEGPRFEVPPIMHQPPEPHVPYSAEIPPPVIGAFSEPPPPIVYQECVPVPQGPPAPAPYGQYDPHYPKPWPPPEEQYQPPTEPYDHQMYNRPQDNTMYQPPPDSSHQMWDPNKEHHGPGEGHEHERYGRGGLLEHPTMHREKELSKERNRDRPWERDMHDYKDDDNRRDHDLKRKDRDRRSREGSWERSSVESDRYRDRDRMRDSCSRDRERDRDRNRDRGPFMDRGPRKDMREGKRPTTPPSPRKMRPHTPQTPPEVDKIITGPRTPKEQEPMDMYDERIEGDVELQEGDNTEEDDGYEEIVSEEEDMSDVEDRTIDMGDIDFDLNDETWNFMSSFSPYSCELTTFQHFSDPVLFTFETEQIKNIKEKNGSALDEKASEASKAFESLNQLKEEQTEKWVETLESISESTLTALAFLKSQEFKDTVDLLIKSTVEGLDFELALRQPQTAYKVRHIKAGIRLATLLFQTNSGIIQQLLDKDIPKYLIQLFDQPYMVLPVKLLILRGIDVVLSTKAGLDYIVNKTVLFSPPKVFDFNLNEKNGKNENLKEESVTCYQRLLELMVSKQLTRAVVSLSAILNKIHIYEVLQELSDCVDKLVQNTQVSDVKNIASESPETIETRAPSVDPEIETDVASNSFDTIAQIIIACLQEITLAYRNAWKNVAQTKRFLPARSQYEFPKSPYNPYPGLLRIFKENKLLESIFVLLSSPNLSGNPGMLSVLKDLFKEFLSSQEGMLFLLSATDVVNGIQRTLLHTEDETREEATEENVAQNLGMQIVYHLQALLYVDALMGCHIKASGAPKKELDEPDAVSALHNMYTMLFSPVGRPSVIDVLTIADNLNALLPFVQTAGDVPLDVKRSKSVCAGYVTELLMLVVHYSENVPTLEKFSDALFNLSQQEATPKLHDLGLWMSPTRSIPNFTHEAVNSLMSILKVHAEHACTLPPELITTLRILQYLTLSKESKEENDELKYMYAIIQVFTNDGMESLKIILQNICDAFLKPSHQSPALVGLQGVLIVAVIKPAISILKSILAHLISSRGTEFKDLTAVPVLLRVFSLMILVPPTSFSYQLAQAVQSEIIEAFLTYTQPFLGSAESEEALSKSLWTEMLQEILKYIKLTPSTFVTGLTVLSELLPLPLPLQTREPLSDDQVTKMVNYRKLWSAHLHSLSSIIQEVIVSLAATSCHPLQQLLRRVCVQFADLAAPTALFIVKAVLDALLEALVLPPPEIKENLDPTVSTPQDSPPMLKAPTSSTARILNLVAYLVSHASFKIPLMHVMRGSVKADEKYLDVLPLMLELFNTPSDKPYVIQSHECIVSILQSLCDPDISFITFESGASLNDVLSSSLPYKEHISLICGALVQHIGCHQHSYSSVLPSLRSLVMLTEHDYGYYHVKHGLDQHPGAIYSLFTRFSLSFSKDSSDCLSTLSTTLEFLRLMVNGYDDGAQTGRSILLSTSELAELLRVDPTKGEKDKKPLEHFQPVVELAKLLTEFGNDEEAVESLLESISGLLTLLKSAVKVKIEKEVTEPVLPSPESQSAQFASRLVFMVGEVEEGRLSPAYWLALPGADDVDQEQEQVPVDLLAIAEKNIPGEFDLKLTLENLCLSNDDGDLKSKKKGIPSIGGKRKYSPFVNPALPDVNNKRPFIAPMRGRGFTRATSHSSRANDPFRSRPPNTSRPPSMHVDDFVALESHHSGSNTQPQVKRPVKDGLRGRGRGFERNPAFTSTRGTGGRFFSPPGPYGRRESNRGGNRGTNRISNNAWNNRSNLNSGQKMSPGPGQRTNFGNHRCDYNSPFNQSENRPSGQRNRDPYTDLGRPSNIIPLNRFQRGSRVGGGMNLGNQGHWQDRGKSQNQRFITPGAPSRGSGRRDMNTRHNRSFTR